MDIRESRVSVIVPFRDGAKWLRLCLESLVAQEFDDQAYEIVAVDNNSRDRSSEIVSEFPMVRLVHEPRIGSYAARNRGVQASRGSILAFTDADCVPQRDWLRRIMAVLDDQRIKVVLGQRLPPLDSPLLALWADYEGAKEEFVFSGAVHELYYGHTNNMAVRRSVFERCGPFLDRLRGSDTVFVHQVVDAFGCRAVVFRPEVRVYHQELTGTAALLRKLFVYGRSSAFYGRIVDARPLTYRHRWELFRHTVQRQRYSTPRAAVLLGLLATGVAAWTLGSWSARLALGREPDASPTSS